MHDSVLEFDLCGIALQLNFIVIGVVSVVVVNVVKGYLMLRLVKSSLDVLLCSLQVSSFLHDRLETVVGQLEGTDWGKTYVVCISVILYHKRLMIQNGTCSKTLHDKLFLGYSLVVRY